MNSYLDLGASILGRFMVFLLKEFRRDTGLMYEAGRIDPEKITEADHQGHRVYLVEVKDGAGTAPWNGEFHQIVVRHGADASLKKSFPEIFERCRARVLPGEDPTRQQLYPEEFFRRGPRPEARRSRTDRSPGHYEIPNNLPKKTDGLVGRKAAVKHVKRTLEHHRLLTLTGSGGCGKTSLAVESARLLLDERTFPDGIRFVGLGNLTEAGQVTFSVATVFKVKEAIGGSLIEALVAAIGKDRILLILDNCEHVIEACTELVLKLLESCLNLRILATSRQPLKLSQDKQNEFKVPALTLPLDRQSAKRAHQDDLQVIADAKAVQLFVDRARSVKHDFALTADNARAVEKIVRRLDGIPGAIVLAAARVYEFGPKDMSKELEKSFDILRQEAQDRLPHQQTIDKIVEWSYRLLKEDEKQLFLRLAVFEGGWDASSAEAVCWGDPVPQDAVRNLLGGLVKKSLVEAEVLPGDGRRYRLLQSTRDFILRRLEEKPSLPLRRRHLDHYLELAEKSEPRLGGIADTMVLNLINVEYANIIAALSWEAEALEDNARRLKLAGAMGRYWETRGYLSEGRRWLELAMAQGDSCSTESRARALLWAGVLAFRQGDYATSRQQLEESLKLWDELKNPHGKATVLQRLGKVVRDEGDYSASQSHYEQSLRIWREIGDDAGTAASLAGLGVVYSDMAYDDETHYAQARIYFKDALRIARGLSDRYRMAPPLNNLGIIERNLGNLDEALRLHLECLKLMTSTQDKAHISLVYYNLGIVYWLRQDFKTAADNHRQSLEISKSLGDKRGIALALEGLARVWQSWGQSDRALKIFIAANAIRDAIHCPMEPNERKHYEASLAEAEKQLEGEPSQAARDEGSRMSPDIAVEFALEGLTTDDATPTE